MSFAPSSVGNTGALSDTGAPSAQVLETARHIDLGDVGEGEAGKSRNIRHREPFSREIGLLAQDTIEISHAGKRSLPALSAPFPILIGLDLGAKAGRRMVEVS